MPDDKFIHFCFGALASGALGKVTSDFVFSDMLFSSGSKVLRVVVALGYNVENHVFSFQAATTESYISHI